MFELVQWTRSYTHTLYQLLRSKYGEQYSKYKVVSFSALSNSSSEVFLNSWWLCTHQFWKFFRSRHVSSLWHQQLLTDYHSSRMWTYALNIASTSQHRKYPLEHRIFNPDSALSRSEYINPSKPTNLKPLSLNTENIIHFHL